MKSKELLAHYDSAQLWSSPTGLDISEAYSEALEVRAHRIARGEQPRGYKIGFTNKSIWPRYAATAPIWGTVYNSTLSFCDGASSLSLAGICQPRIEPEAVLSLRATPPQQCSLEQLFDCVESVAPGFEIVQSHLKDWKFALPDAVADGSLHARLLVSKQVSVHYLAANAEDLCKLLAACKVRLLCDGVHKDAGLGSNVLGDPLSALQHFVHEIQRCPGAPALKAGDVITTGTWTDAFAVATGQMWLADFDSPLSPLSINF
ncbi:hydratase [Variovorax sp. PCZ-1]|uniref:2-keto-4-pentenoate hydratase n=1 Tax=Variovorax sp. PCZ-1 TaxID=2835533 RepID=UPI001BD16D71|nr:hydratase [Variovorax sp. PCZ-1]MBS7807539.1 hydratase [Variovorax sp. PCZ-1]